MAKTTGVSPLLLVLLLGACASPEETEIDTAGKADSPFGTADLINGTAPAVGLLRFANDSTTTVALLREAVGLRSDAADNLVNHRDGFGGTPANAFDDIDELDLVPQIGEAALQDLLDFAFDNGFVPQGEELLGSYDGVSFTVNQASAVTALVNSASQSRLDDEFALDSRAVDAIVEARPVASVLALSELSFVGMSALEKLKSEISAAPREIGVVSDLDKTIVPPAPAGQDLPDAPYPGIAELLSILEFSDGSGLAGDVSFVTARQPESVVEIPTWLADHGVPLGPISTGISGIPFLAKDEKIRDISAIFEANPGQSFVMFGDSSHVDPDAYRAIASGFPDQVQVAFIHDVKDIDSARLVGLVLIDNYAQAAAELFRQRVISEDEARAVMLAVVAGGDISVTELEELITANQPN